MLTTSDVHLIQLTTDGARRRGYKPTMPEARFIAGETWSGRFPTFVLRERAGLTDDFDRSDDCELPLVAMTRRKAPSARNSAFSLLPAGDPPTGRQSDRSATADGPR